jgi:hypothetical protein
MSELADPSIWPAPSGTRYELECGSDSTTAYLFIVREGKMTKGLKLTIQQLDELREFLSDNIE